MKKILILVMSLVLLGGMVFGATESAQVIITTSVGETTANSGIRVIETRPSSFDISQPVFDPVFFTAIDSLYLSSGVDTSLENATGTFTVLVRRPVVSSATLGVSATKMTLTGGTHNIPYTLTPTGETVSIINMLGTGETEVDDDEETITITPSDGSVLRWFGDFTYTIPKAESAPLGAYSATITFTITTT